MRYFDGSPPEVMKFGTAWPGANFELIDKTTEVAPGVHLIALISDKPGTLELKELSLAIDTPEGIVLVVGCSHPGIDKIVEATTAINNRIHLIAGGLHLVVAKDADIATIVTALHDTYRVAWVAPGHCTGEPAFAGHQPTWQSICHWPRGSISPGRLARWGIAQARAGKKTFDLGSAGRALASSGPKLISRVVAKGLSREFDA